MDIFIADLAQIMVMERTTLVRALKPLQAAGFIVSRAEGKRSASRLLLSPEGKAKFEATLPAWNAAQAELEAEMGEDLAASMRAALLAVVPDV
ncbi:MarR family winged helix-turn-helix transcriptional regulator [Pseudomonas sp. UBA1879]|uniref:MarR family winged helix-turn-helix transcriptional regulator n=1 Tax=Pseudomonas sp. UBA1879 TaxID=1947305 RepID=UPI0025CDB071|nr:MarR family winged helix-turn-helix transcriptional regulator [Pseudomonas sp. UBA1879]